MKINFWLFASLTVTIVAFISYGTYATARLLRDWRPDRNLLLLPAENLLRLVLIVLCLMLGLLSGASFAQLGWTFPNGSRSLIEGVLWGSLGGVALALFFYLSTKGLVAYTGKRFYSSVVIQAITPKSRYELVLVLLVMVPVVLLEELLFRSLLIGGFALVFPTPVLVVGWGIFFGLLHSPQGWWGMVGAGLAGLLLGTLFVLQGSILLPIVVHYVTNALQIVQAMRLHYAEARSPTGNEEPRFS